MELDLTIRATNGANWITEDFHPNQKVDVVRRKSIDHFVDLGIMTPGGYLLALVAGGQARELPDSEDLADAGVVPGSVLALVVRGPQVDG